MQLLIHVGLIFDGKFCLKSGPSKIENYYGPSIYYVSKMAGWIQIFFLLMLCAVFKPT